MGKLNEKLNYLAYAGLVVGSTAFMFIMTLILGLVNSLGATMALTAISWIYVIAMIVASIYLKYLRCEAIHNLNMACGLKENGDRSNKSQNFVIVDLLTSVTLGIYGLYWVYRQEARMIEIGRSYKISNQFESETKKAFIFIIAGLACKIVGVIFFIAYLGAVADNFLVFALRGESGGEIALRIFALLFILAGIVLDAAGYYLFYHDINILSAAFNRETYNGTFIVCDRHRDKLKGGNGNGDLKQVKPMDGKVRMLSGQYAGSEIRLKPGENIVIGREPSKCDLICSSEKVSRVHLSIAYRAVGGKGEYFVKDMSTNGTISSKTGKLPKEQEVKQPVGAVLTLGQSTESIQLL
ncbi:DUF4234 domain-containing protein [Eubacterium sp. An3]|uniref:DUF4234 domain-containing protein n=1 Tax=Eubacterium sp. An3 TaxID=1965628 RepID=UPI000B38584C|nr:DUF4234 domain-containing protein [Eubacterium sp. An3]OUO29620.1 hypothetical protein B5F87_03705 [Eubacterium sp. An3]